MDSTIKAALIGAGATIAAALIAGYFLLRKPTEPDSPKAPIAEPKPPKLDKLLLVAEEILDRNNQSLLENQQILSPIIRHPSQRYSVGEEMAKLFEEQGDRAAFGEWQAFLENALTDEDNPRIRKEIEELLDCVRKLYAAFYSYHSAVEERGEMETKKHFIELVLTNRGTGPARNQFSDEEVSRTARTYLDFLRQTLERIGRATGNLRAMK